MSEEFRIWSLIMHSRSCPGVPFLTNIPKPNVRRNGYKVGKSINMTTRGRRNKCIRKLRSVSYFKNPKKINNECPSGWFVGSDGKCKQTCVSNKQTRDSEGRCICNSMDNNHRECIKGSKCSFNGGWSYVCQPN